MTIGLIIITGLYTLLIASFCIGFIKLPLFIHDKTIPTTSFSVIIPFRNEAENLLKVLDSISSLDYPKRLFETILVNDGSEDNSETIINQFITTHPQCSIRLLTSASQSKSPKKEAITLGISQAKNEWIVTTDADCIVPKKWLSVFNAFITQNNTVFIAAPVTYCKVNSFLKRFQALDFLSLIGTTIGSFGLHLAFMCNGANLAYKKSAFLRVNGFFGNTHIASGDDIFLLEKIKKHYPKQFHYIKNKQIVVKTQPEHTFKAMLFQRMRWAAKATHYNSVFAKFIGMTVFVMNSAIILGLLLVLLKTISLITVAICLLIKCIVDFVLLYITSRLFNQQHFLRAVLSSSILYPIFSVYVALASQFESYTWKNRTFKK